MQLTGSQLSLTDLDLCFHWRGKVTEGDLAQMQVRNLVAES